MAKHRPRLNVFGRQLLVHRIEDEGWPVARAAEAAGVSRTTAHKWLARYRAEGESGLMDRSSRTTTQIRFPYDQPLFGHAEAPDPAEVKRAMQVLRGPTRIARTTRYLRITASTSTPTSRFSSNRSTSLRMRANSTRRR